MESISVILPSYNEKENIAKSEAALRKVFETMGMDYELFYVSDGSKDGTFEEIKRVAKENSNVKGVEFSRNFGKEAAIFAGLSLASGDAIIVMDCDLQHPPELIPQMVALCQEGYEVVEGVKSDRGTESILHRFFANSFYGIMSKLMHMDMRASSDYKLLDRKVVNILAGLQERNTFFRALSFWAGFKSTKIEYEVQDREFGESKWSFRSLVRYAISNVTGFSTAPLHIVTVGGMVSILFSIVLGIQTLIRYIMRDSVEGFTTVILLILLIGGMIMLSLGIIGHYIARIYEEVKGRPRFIIRSSTENLYGNITGEWKK